MGSCFKFILKICIGILCYSGNQHKVNIQIQYTINSNMHEVQTGMLIFIVSDVSDIYFM